MDPLRWSYRPTLRAPYVIAAFEGWNDAGDAATSATTWFTDRWMADEFAEIDPEEFFDFTATRPQVRIEDGERVIDWPSTTLSAGTVPGTDVDVILVRGVEPSLRWRTFCESVVGVANAFGARMVITLGALLAEVAHSRPIDLVGTTTDAEVATRLGLRPSRYEGPTGIVGVLHAHCHAAGLPSASVWAAVPSYVPSAPCPKAALALVHRAAEFLDVPVITTDLEIAAAAYERQISELVDADEETQGYVEAIERRQDARESPFGAAFADLDDLGEMVLGEPTELISEVEQFLRERGE